MRSTAVRAMAAAALGALTLAACGGDGGTTGGTDKETVTSLRLMAPAAPGGGWDSTARSMQQVFDKTGVVDDVEVFNVPGAGGTIGLARLANERQNGELLMVMGLVMVGAIETNKSAATLDDVTPIARLTSEQEAIVVPAGSPYKTLADFVRAWKADPGKLAIAGGSAGGTDQIFAGLLAQAAGVDVTKLNYVAYSGGGEALAAILGGKVAAGISGVSEFTAQIAAGKLRPLAVSGGARVAGVDAPTVKEAGFDVELLNWRGVVAPAGISDERREALVDAVTRMHGSAEWKAVLEQKQWDDAFLAGDEFTSYLADEKTRIRAVLGSLGLV